MIDTLKIRNMEKDDWNAVAKIYQEGIATKLATFEKEIPSWEQWHHNHLDICRLVAVLKDEIIGWAALSEVSSRCVYRGVAEVSVYVSQKARRKNIGKKLMLALIKNSEANGFWTLQSAIFAENTPSMELHKKVGFRIIGYREKIGRLNGSWKDNVLMERRSKVVGQ